jgi:peroxiredoxin Q/BCP
MRDFSSNNAKIIGISKDIIAKHDKFKAKYNLPFQLGSDLDGAVCEAYGTWVEKLMYGRQYMGIERATFLVDKEGILRSIWRKVKVKGHVEEVLEAVGKL